jgi:hypothetical protein
VNMRLSATDPPRRRLGAAKEQKVGFIEEKRPIHWLKFAEKLYLNRRQLRFSGT